MEIDWNDPKNIDLLKKTVCKGASDAEFDLFMKVCQRTGLDPFARQIYAVRRKQWNQETRQYEEMQIIQISIDGFRLIADRTSRYAGQVGPWWCGPDGEWREVWLETEPPSAARVGVLRHDFNQPLYSVALMKAYIQTNKEGKPVSRWGVDPAGMLAKCAEALALRRAFPQELSGLYTSEEMGKVNGDAAQAIEGVVHPALPEPVEMIDNLPVIEREPVTVTPPTNGNGKQVTPEQIKVVSDAIIDRQSEVIDHIVAMTSLKREHVINTLKKSTLPATATLKDFEIWWENYRGERATGKNSDQAAEFANGEYTRAQVMQPDEYPLYNAKLD